MAVEKNVQVTATGSADKGRMTFADLREFVQACEAAGLDDGAVFEAATLIRDSTLTKLKAKG